MDLLHWLQNQFNRLYRIQQQQREVTNEVDEVFWFEYEAIVQQQSSPFTKQLTQIFSTIGSLFNIHPSKKEQSFRMKRMKPAMFLFLPLNILLLLLFNLCFIDRELQQYAGQFLVHSMIWCSLSVICLIFLLLFHYKIIIYRLWFLFQYEPPIPTAATAAATTPSRDQTPSGNMGLGHRNTDRQRINQMQYDDQDSFNNQYLSQWMEIGWTIITVRLFLLIVRVSRYSTSIGFINKSGPYAEQIEYEAVPFCLEELDLLQHDKTIKDHSFLYMYLLILLDFSQVFILSMLPFPTPWAGILSIIEVASQILRILTCGKRIFSGSQLDLIITRLTLAMGTSIFIICLQPLFFERSLREYFLHLQSQHLQMKQKKLMITTLAKDVKIQLQYILHAIGLLRNSMMMNSFGVFGGDSMDRRRNDVEGTSMMNSFGVFGGDSMDHRRNDKNQKISLQHHIEYIQHIITTINVLTDNMLILIRTNDEQYISQMKRLRLHLPAFLQSICEAIGMEVEQLDPLHEMEHNTSINERLIQFKANGNGIIVNIKCPNEIIQIDRYCFTAVLKQLLQQQQHHNDDTDDIDEIQIQSQGYEMIHTYCTIHFHLEGNGLIKIIAKRWSDHQQNEISTFSRIQQPIFGFYNSDVYHQQKHPKLVEKERIQWYSSNIVCRTLVASSEGGSFHSSCGWELNNDERDARTLQGFINDLNNHHLVFRWSISLPCRHIQSTVRQSSTSASCVDESNASSATDRNSHSSAERRGKKLKFSFICRNAVDRDIIISVLRDVNALSSATNPFESVGSLGSNNSRCIFGEDLQNLEVFDSPSLFQPQMSEQASIRWHQMLFSIQQSDFVFTHEIQDCEWLKSSSLQMKFTGSIILFTRDTTLFYGTLDTCVDYVVPYYCDQFDVRGLHMWIRRSLSTSIGSESSQGNDEMMIGQSSPLQSMEIISESIDTEQSLLHDEDHARNHLQSNQTKRGLRNRGHNRNALLSRIWNIINVTSTCIMYCLMKIKQLFYYIMPWDNNIKGLSFSTKTIATQRIITFDECYTKWRLLNPGQSILHHSHILSLILMASFLEAFIGVLFLEVGVWNSFRVFVPILLLSRGTLYKYLFHPLGIPVYVFWNSIVALLLIWKIQYFVLLATQYGSQSESWKEHDVHEFLKSRYATNLTWRMASFMWQPNAMYRPPTMVFLWLIFMYFERALTILIGLGAFLNTGTMTLTQLFLLGTYLHYFVMTHYFQTWHYSEFTALHKVLMEKAFHRNTVDRGQKELLKHLGALNSLIKSTIRYSITNVRQVLMRKALPEPVLPFLAPGSQQVLSLEDASHYTNETLHLAELLAEHAEVKLALLDDQQLNNIIRRRNDVFFREEVSSLIWKLYRSFDSSINVMKFSIRVDVQQELVYISINVAVLRAVIISMCLPILQSLQNTRRIDDRIGAQSHSMILRLSCCEEDGQRYINNFFGRRSLRIEVMDSLFAMDAPQINAVSEGQYATHLSSVLVDGELERLNVAIDASMSPDDETTDRDAMSLPNEKSSEVYDRAILKMLEYYDGSPCTDAPTRSAFTIKTRSLPASSRHLNRIQVVNFPYTVNQFSYRLQNMACRTREQQRGIESNPSTVLRYVRLINLNGKRTELAFNTMKRRKEQCKKWFHIMDDSTGIFTPEKSQYLREKHLQRELIFFCATHKYNRRDLLQLSANFTCFGWNVTHTLLWTIPSKYKNCLSADCVVIDSSLSNAMNGTINSSTDPAADDDYGIFKLILRLRMSGFRQLIVVLAGNENEYANIKRQDIISTLSLAQPDLVVYKPLVRPGLKSICLAHDDLIVREHIQGINGYSLQNEDHHDSDFN